MLSELSITDFAIIDRARLRLGPGFNVLTGETGAGKSILIDAVQAIMGGRVSADMIRTGADEAVIQASFELSATGDVSSALDAAGIPSADGQLVLTRELARQGRNTCRANGRIVTAGFLSDITAHLIDVCGQHDSQSLTRPGEQLLVLDRFAGTSALNLRARVGELHSQYGELTRRAADLAGQARERERRLDVLRYQVADIQGAGLRDGEFERLSEERTVLSNAETLAAAAASGFALLYEAHDASSATDLAGSALEQLESASRLDSRLAGQVDELRDCYFRLQSLGRDLARYRESVAYDPDRLAEINQRLDELRSLRRKYGGTDEEIQAYLSQAQSELTQLETADDTLAGLQAESERLACELSTEAARLSSLRHGAARELERAVMTELADLGLGEATFVIELTSRPSGQAVASDGSDVCRMMFSANAGEEPKPIGRVASGGELSRFMLAVKKALADRDSIPTVIFDEIDANVGGVMAGALARKISEVSSDHQVICVTHQPRIAAVADTHHRIVKTPAETGPTVEVDRVTDGAREDEIIRMLGGLESTRVAAAHARDLLARGRSSGG